MWIVDNIKTVVYEFYYEFAKKMFRADCKPYYLDTDLLIYLVKIFYCLWIQV